VLATELHSPWAACVSWAVSAGIIEDQDDGQETGLMTFR